MTHEEEIRGKSVFFRLKRGRKYGQKGRKILRIFWTFCCIKTRHNEEILICINYLTHSCGVSKGYANSFSKTIAICGNNSATCVKSGDITYS
jgi:hypothetical protein